MTVAYVRFSLLILQKKKQANQTFGASDKLLGW